MDAALHTGGPTLAQPVAQSDLSNEPHSVARWHTDAQYAVHATVALSSSQESWR
jgi:hypothetical protein